MTEMVLLYGFFFIVGQNACFHLKGIMGEELNEKSVRILPIKRAVW